MTGIDLEQKHLTEVQRILAAFVPHYEVWAFGSRVSGKAKPYSDLDMVIVTDQPVPPAVMSDLRDAFAESDLPMKVDLVDWATTSESFRRIIEQERVLVQNKDR